MKKIWLILVLVGGIAVTCGLFVFEKKDREITVPGIQAAGEAAANVPMNESREDLRNIKGRVENRGVDSLTRFNQAMAKAEAGDASAQRYVSTALESCLSYSVSPERFSQSLDALSQQDPAQKPYMDSLKERMEDSCAFVEKDHPILIADYKGWLIKAAENGDTAAKIRLMARESEAPSSNVTRGLASEAVSSSDPAALFEMTDLMLGVSDSDELGEFGSLSGPGAASYAWGIVACRQGMDCGAGSPVMDSICINTASCTSADFEQFIREHMISSADNGRLDQAIARIDGMINKHE